MEKWVFREGSFILFYTPAPPLPLSYFFVLLYFWCLFTGRRSTWHLLTIRHCTRDRRVVLRIAMGCLKSGSEICGKSDCPRVCVFCSFVFRLRCLTADHANKMHVCAAGNIYLTKNSAFFSFFYLTNRRLCPPFLSTRSALKFCRDVSN